MKTPTYWAEMIQLGVKEIGEVPISMRDEVLKMLLPPKPAPKPKKKKPK